MAEFAATGALTDLTQSADMNDSGAVWSPDGRQIAFLRQRWTDGELERGNQIWLMDADGGLPRPLTAVPNTLHQNLVWSMDSHYLLYQQYDLETRLAQPTIWLLELENGRTRQLVGPGSNPGWLRW